MVTGTEKPTRRFELPRALKGLAVGVLPEAYGIAIVLLLVAAFGGLAWLTRSIMADQARIAMVDQAKTAARGVAAAINGLDDDTQRAARFKQYCRDSNAPTARYINGTGARIAEWPADGGTSFPTTQPAGAADPLAAAPVADATGKNAGTVQVLVEPAGVSKALTGWIMWAAIICFMVLVSFWTLTRRVQKRVLPHTAIEQNLNAFSAGVERQFTALALSDTLGQVAVAWNRVVQHVAELQQCSGGRGDATAIAMKRFESRALRQILDHLPVGVLRIDRSQVVSYANASAVRLLKTGEDLTGAVAGEALGVSEAHEWLASATTNPTSATLDRKLGEEECATILRLTALPGGCAEGETIVTVEDVTHMHEVEKARDHFLYHVTHELRTPLTNIQAYAETLTRPAFDDEQTRRECYNVIVSETRRLSRLVEDILSISQLEVGSARIEMSELDLAKLVRQMVQDNLGAADEKKVELSLRLPPRVPKLRGDKQRLGVLLNNLIGNAVKYTPEGGRVSVTVEADDVGVLIDVTDTGIGISPDDQAHVFDKFYRAANDAVQTIPGTGLGLAIAREVARLHGGAIHVQSELGKGSTFSVSLPLPRSETTTSR